MKVRYTIILLAVPVLLALLLIAAGCEDSELTLGGDGAILLSVNPGTITIDPNQGETEGSATIIASVYDSVGNPLQNISVLFSTTGGALASGSQHVRTDANGLATDLLTAVPGDPDTITITAQSSLVSEQEEITLQVLEDNQPPTALVVDTPTGEQEINKIFTMDGTLSTDPDGDVITCYQWEIDSEIDAYDEVIQGAGASSLSKRYSVEQGMSFTLRVSDRGDAGSMCTEGGTPVPLDLFSGNAALVNYEITCDNTPPVADAGPDQHALPGTSVLLDGCTSTDEEDPYSQLDYRWNCGNGLPPSGSGCQVFCTYQAVSTYTVTLTVYDRGNGNLVGGNWECQKWDEDTALVDVFVPTD